MKVLSSSVVVPSWWVARWSLFAVAVVPVVAVVVAVAVRPCPRASGSPVARSPSPSPPWSGGSVSVGVGGSGSVVGSGGVRSRSRVVAVVASLVVDLVALVARPRRGRFPSPPGGGSSPPGGGQAYFSLPIGYTRRHPKAPPIITDYRQIHRKKLPKAPKSSQNLPFSRFFMFSVSVGVSGRSGVVSVWSSPVGLSLSPCRGSPRVLSPPLSPRGRCRSGCRAVGRGNAPARRTIGKNPVAVAPFRVGFLSIKTDSRPVTVR